MGFDWNQFQDGFKTVSALTPWLGTFIVVSRIAGPRMPGGFVGRAVMGAANGAITGGVWEYTMRSDDPTVLKWEIITGTAVVGAGSAVVFG